MIDHNDDAQLYLYASDFCMDNFYDELMSANICTGKLKMPELIHYPMEDSIFTRRSLHNLCGFIQGVSVHFQSIVSMS